MVARTSKTFTKTATASAAENIAQDIRDHADVNYVDPKHQGKRNIAGLLIGLISVGAGGYQASLYAPMVIAAAFSLAWPVFITWALIVIAALFAAWLLIATSASTGQFVADGGVEIAARKSTRWVRSLFVFGSKDKS